VHTIPIEADILLKKSDFSHIYFEKLVESKIPAFSGIASDNNRLILKSIALNGPMLKYNITKTARIGRYSTASRRVDNLANRGYVAEAGKRVTERGKKTEESMYGLTWKGFIASITIDEVRANMLRVLEINPLLVFPEKELILPLVEEIMTPQELETIIISLVETLLKTIPDLELVEDKQLFFFLMSALVGLRLPKNFMLSRIPKDAWELLDKPAILQIMKERIVPFLKQYIDGIKAMYLLVSAFEGFDKFFYELDVKNKPSEKMREFVETRLSTLKEKAKEEEDSACLMTK
jgi:hypothetical protein